MYLNENGNNILYQWSNYLYLYYMVVRPTISFLNKVAPILIIRKCRYTPHRIIYTYIKACKSGASRRIPRRG